MDRASSLRKLVLKKLVRVMAVVGAIAYIPSLYACIQTRMWLLAAANSLSFVMFIAAAVSRRMGPKVKLALVVGGSLAISGFVLFSTGSQGAGYIWLIASILIASLMGGRAILGLTAAGAGLILGGYIALVALGRSPFGDKLLTVVVIAANLVLICTLVALLARALIDGLEAANAEEERLAAKLGEELAAVKAADEALHAEIETKEGLLRELDHRVRNNMQVVLSLLDIEALRGNKDANTHRRVRVLAQANDLALMDPAASAIELRSLVVAIFSGYRLPDGGSSFSTGRFSMGLGLDRITSVAIALGEIAEGLAALCLPIAVGLEGRGGEEELLFRWKPPSPLADSSASAGSARACVEGLNSNAILGSLASPEALSLREREADGEAFLSIRLAGL